MEFLSLASGSSGNSYYIEESGSAILIDAGLSLKKIKASLALHKKSADNIKALFITHEHTDHICGALTLSRTLNIPVYATSKTISYSALSSAENLHPINNNQKISLKPFTIQAFPKSHSASDPISFSISSKNKTLSVITDLGHVCKHTKKAISLSDFLVLESNHDVSRLKNGPYPAFLKSWILSDSGHLSNAQAALALLEFSSPKLRDVMLAHLSQTNNLPQLAHKTVSKILQQRLYPPSIHLAPRTESSALFVI